MLAMKTASEQLYLEEQVARAARAGAELALRELRKAMREIKRARLGVPASEVDHEQELVALQRAVERTVHALTGEETVAHGRYERTPTAQGLMPVQVPANTNG